MDIARTQRPKALWLGSLLVALLLALLFTGCAGIEPYEPRNIRVEGMEHGIISGSEGEFVIYRKSEEPETGTKSDKKSDETADNE